MLAHPENNRHIAPMPRPALVIIEKPIRVLIVRFAGQHPDPLRRRPRRLRRDILLPHDAQEQRPSGVHDGHIRQPPIAIIRLEVRDYVFVKRMSGRRAQRIVANARRRRATCPGRIL